MTTNFVNQTSVDSNRTYNSTDFRNKRASQKIEKFKLRDIINQLLDIRRMTSEYLQKKLRRFFYMDLIILWISSFLYLVYLYLPLLCLKFVKKKVILEFQRASKCNSFIHKIILWINGLIIAVKYLLDMLVNYPVYDIFLPLCKIIVEVYTFLSHSSKSSSRKYTSDNQHAELISYEEIENDLIPLTIQQKITDRMHHKIPLTKFRAMISTSSNNNTNNNRRQINNNNHDKSFEEGSHSPLSFPTSPLSRAIIMNKYASRVENLMFTARDLLRIESQSKSSDEFSRNSATNFMKLGTFAIFDPTYISDALSLSSGNHCVEMTRGTTTCASCRSMVPIPVNTFVYFEFTISTIPSSATTSPVVAIGLAPPDSPLNVITGTWPRSISLCSDGSLLVCGKRHASTQPLPLLPGSTIGMLVLISEAYLPPQFSESDYLDSSGGFTSGVASPSARSNNLSLKYSASNHSNNGNNSINNSNNSSRSRSSSSNSNASASSNASTVVRTKPHWILRNLMKPFSYYGGSRGSSCSNLKCTSRTSMKSNNHNNNNNNTNYDQRSVRSQSSHENTIKTRSSQSDKIYTTYPKSLHQGSEKYASNMTSPSSEPPPPPATSSQQQQQQQLQLQVEDECQDAFNSLNPEERGMMKIEVHSPPPPAYTFFFKYNIDGLSLEFPSEVVEAASSEVADLNSPLFPSLSILVKDTKIWCRFCADDILCRQRGGLGAPTGSRVYSLDGSLLLSEYD